MLLFRWFLAIVVAAPVFAQTIRVTADVPRQHASLWRGLEFGAREAKHTARLLGRDFQLVTTPSPVIIRGPVVTITAAGRTYRLSPASKKAWLPSLQKFGAGELNERFLRETRHPMDEAAWLGWMAVKIAAEAALRNQDIGKVKVDGHKGVALRFDAKGQLVQALYD
jgi:hypothetical protein